MNISIVIISYNSERFLERNLYSLVNQSLPFSRIIIVDNASTDRSLEIARGFTFLDYIQILELETNQGYAAGANLGIAQTNTPLVVVANSDIILDNEFNARVVEKFTQEEDIDLLSPLILRFDKKTVDSAGQACSRALHPAEMGYNCLLENVDISEKPVFSVCGAATVFHRRALEKLKLNDQYYDEDFFIFWEDFDIGWRAQLLAMKTIFFPGAVVYHYRSGTLKPHLFSRFSLALARPGTIKYHLVKNRYLTLIKNFRLKRNCGNLIFIFFKDLIWVPLLTICSPKIIINLLKSGRYFKQAVRNRNELKKKEKSIHAGR